MTAHEAKQVDDNLSQQIEIGLQAVEDAMMNAVDSSVTVLRDTSQHILAAGGKRVRPRILLLSYLASNGGNVKEVAQVAAAIELMHTASVVHDDINDHGIMRRGQPSINAVWGRTFALLTGDFLFTKVYELMAPFKDLNVILSEAATALVEGETLQASAVKENTFTREVYSRIIALKTAALFKASGMLGAKLANAPDDVAEALGNYGYYVGLAFQIVDDILDIVGEEAVLGKTSGIDMAQGRGFAAAYTPNGDKIDETPTKNEDVMDSIKRKMLAGDALEKARQQSEQLVQLAISQLDILPDNAIRDELIQQAEDIINRQY